MKLDDVRVFLKAHFAEYVTNEEQLGEVINELFSKIDGDNDK